MTDVKGHEVADMVETQEAPSTMAGRVAGLEARGIHAWFDKHHALEDINLFFPANTVTGLIGPSGCGKSTFLRILNRMHEFIPRAAMAGEVMLHDADIYDPSVNPAEIRLKIGWCSRNRIRSPR